MLFQAATESCNIPPKPIARFFQECSLVNSVGISIKDCSKVKQKQSLLTLDQMESRTYMCSAILKNIGRVPNLLEGVVTYKELS